VLAATLGCAPREVRFTRRRAACGGTDHGRPRSVLLRQPRAGGAAIAVLHGAAVGLDVAANSAGPAPEEYLRLIEDRLRPCLLHSLASTTRLIRVC
jgi:hypothetical protein